MAKPTVVKSPAQPAEKQARMPIIDNPSAPDLCADEIIGAMIANNTLRITFGTVKADHSKAPNTNINRCVVNGRLILPIHAAQNLHNMLGAILNKVKAKQAEENTPKIETLQ